MDLIIQKICVETGMSAKSLTVRRKKSAMKKKFANDEYSEKLRVSRMGINLTKEEVYDDFDYFLFTALMDTRDMLIDVIQDRAVPMQKRLWKLLAVAHDFQLCVTKNELFKWEEIRKRHEDSGYGDGFCSKVYSRINADNTENISN